MSLPCTFQWYPSRANLIWPVGPFTHLWAVHIEPPLADEVDLVEEGAVGTEEAVPSQVASPIPCKGSKKEVYSTFFLYLSLSSLFDEVNRVRTSRGNIQNIPVRSLLLLQSSLENSYSPSVCVCIYINSPPPFPAKFPSFDKIFCHMNGHWIQKEEGEENSQNWVNYIFRYFSSIFATFYSPPPLPILGEMNTLHLHKLGKWGGGGVEGGKKVFPSANELLVIVLVLALHLYFHWQLVVLALAPELVLALALALAR